MTTQYWLVKSEPESYSWDNLVRDKKTSWTGVRNYAARLHLKAMNRGDRVLFYESVTTKAVMGIGEVSKAAYPDKTADEEGWVAVDIAALKGLKTPVTLEQIKSEPTLDGMVLLRQSRLSVTPLSPNEFNLIVKMGS